MRYFSMFSGIGGFEYGTGNYGECIGYSEIDKYATAIYDYQFGGRCGDRLCSKERQEGLSCVQPEWNSTIATSKNRHPQVNGNTKGHKNYGNATDIIPEDLPDFDLLVGGFPCQAFSIAGKRLGFDDTRGTLFFEIARILKVKRPKHFILENVKGLLSHDNGRTFKTIIATLVELGYGVEWQVLNSKNHGVPQNRERVFIVGHLGGEGCGKVFPIGEDDKVFNERQGKISPTITQRYYKQGQSDPYIACEETESSEQSLSQKRNKSNNPNSRGGQTYSADIRIRRLTPTECERLQGFPDNWTKYGIMNGQVVEISDSQRYKCLGNAVTTNVVRCVVERLFNSNQ